MKRNDALHFVIGFLSVITLFALFNRLFEQHKTNKCVGYSSDEDDASNFQNDRDAIWGDMNTAFKKMAS